MNYLRVPQELREYRQFIVWKGNKEPFQVNGHRASVTDPSHWASFEEAHAGIKSGEFVGLGFVFTRNDPFVGIDLDNPYALKPDGTPKFRNPDRVLEHQKAIFDAFPGYAERSPSGTGLHMIVKGTLPSGRRREAVEVYPHERFFTMTGDVFRDGAILDAGPHLVTLWEEMGKDAPAVYMDGNEPETASDEEIVARAKAASNGDKFNSLFSGDWQSFYGSQSEADFALVDMLGFYTQNRFQIGRLFRSSGLGQREKAQRSSYLESMIKRSFDRMLPPVDTDALFNAHSDARSGVGLPHSAPSEPLAASAPLNGFEAGGDAVSSPVSVSPPSVSPANPASIFPPGLLGEIAEFIYQSSPRPVREVALAGAIGLMAGICGRSYNVSRTGLNQYVLLVAKTGVGKESMASGISHIMSECEMRVPSIADFMGPGRIASGQGLRKFMARSKTNCFVSVIGEVGFMLQRISDPRATAADKEIQAVLLDLFAKSGAKKILEKDAYSDADKETPTIYSPALTLVGEGTPSSVFDNLRERDITSGLIPRFLFIHYEGKRVYNNKNADKVEPSISLINHVCNLAENALTLGHNRKVCTVELDDEAQAFADKLDVSTTNQINDNDGDVIRDIWNRVHLKTLKLAALCAVGQETYFPRVTINEMMWAYNIVMADAEIMVRKFQAGEIGQRMDDDAQTTFIVGLIREYLSGNRELGAHKKYKEDGVITYSYLHPRSVNVKQFKDAPGGATNALKRILTALCERGDLVEMPSNQIKETYGKGGKAYGVVDPLTFGKS